MKNLKLLFLIFSLSFIAILNSCNDNNLQPNNDDNVLDGLYQIYTKNVADSLIASGEIPAKIDGIQVIAKYYGNYYQTEGSIDNNSNKTSVAYSFHLINNKISHAKNAKVDGITMENFTGYPVRHRYFWENGDSPDYSSPTHWQFTIGSETVYDIITVPSNFGNLSFSTDSLNLNNGITFSWAGSTGDILMSVSYVIKDTITNAILTNKVAQTFYTEDDGSFSFTPTLLSDWGVPNDGTVHTFIVYLHRWNLNFKKYDSGNKVLMSIGAVECNAVCRVK